MQAKHVGMMLAAAVAFTVGCGGGSKSGGGSDVPEQKSMSEKEAEVTDEDVAEVMADGAQHDEDFHNRVLERGTRKAGECAAMGAPTDEEGEVTVIFDGKLGRVTDVELGYPYADAGDQAQKCIKNAFKGEMIPPFEGEVKTPHKLTIPAKKDGK